MAKRKLDNKEKKIEGRVRLSRAGCERPPIHRCYPTTVWRGSFSLLCFHPGPVRSSLTNLENPESSVFTILTPNLARTPDLHRTSTPRNPSLKPFNDPSLQVTGLQACATTPGWRNTNKIKRSIVTRLDCTPKVENIVLEDQTTLRFLLKTAENLYWTPNIVFTMLFNYSLSQFGFRSSARSLIVEFEVDGFPKHFCFPKHFFTYCFCILREFTKVFDRNVWRVEVAHLQNAGRALSSQSRVLIVNKSWQRFLSLSMIMR